MSDLAASARRIGEAVGHLRSTFVDHVPVPEGSDRCPGCRAERAARVELEAAVEAERMRWSPVLEIVEGFTLEWAIAAQKDDHLCNLDHKDEMIFGELVEAVLRARSAKIAEASLTPSSPRGGELCDPHTPRGLGVKEEPA